MKPSKKPHIIIFNPDQMRADSLAHMGNPAAVTPHFDQLAREDGVSFSHTVCQNPVCVPSRCSFLTGLYPHVRGHRSMFHMLQVDEPHLFKYLKEDGYHVWLSARNDFLPAQNPNCYLGSADEIMGKPVVEKSAPVDVDMAKVNEILSKFMSQPAPHRGSPDSDTYYSFYIGRLKEAAAKDGPFPSDDITMAKALECIATYDSERPLCLFVGLGFPHPPYGVEDPFYSMIDRSKLPPRIPTPEDWAKLPSIMKGLVQEQHLQTWTEERWTELRATYLAMVAKVDYQYGKLVDALKRAGMYDDSAIFVLSDHGDYTGDYGIVEKNQNTFQDCLVNVPLMVKPPKGVPFTPGVNDALVELIDFYATAEDFAGYQPAHTHFGRSLRQALADHRLEVRDAVFCEGGRLKDETQCMETEASPNLDPRMEYYPRMKLQRSAGPEHTKSTMCRTHRHKYIRRLYETDELYDLVTDPQELHNRIDDSAMADILLELKERMLTHYQETSDTVPMKPDSRFNLAELVPPS